MTEIWKPSVVVAAVVEREGRFLLVEEETESGIRFNQPAGHLEPGESLVSAVCRETLEESGYRFEPVALIGIYLLAHPAPHPTYLRFAFTGSVHDYDPSRTLDHGIIRAAWFSPREIIQSRSRHRSPLVLRCVEDYLAGRRYPLELLADYAQ